LNPFIAYEKNEVLLIRPLEAVFKFLKLYLMHKLELVSGKPFNPGLMFVIKAFGLKTETLL